MILISGDYTSKHIPNPMQKKVAVHATSSNDFVSDHLEQLTVRIMEMELDKFVLEVARRTFWTAVGDGERHVECL